MGYFYKLLFTEEMLDKCIQSTDFYFIHYCLSLFKKKQYFSLNEILNKDIYYCPEMLLNSYKTLTLLNQGLLSLAEQTLDENNPYYSSFLEYLDL